jgi:hypothetical protein
MKKLTLAALTALALPTAAHATAQTGFGLGIEPIIGYERVQKLLPTRHTKDRLTYGARLTVGIPLFGVEAQYTRGTDTETFPADDLSVKDTDDKLKLGLVSSMRLGPIFSIIARGGGQAKRHTTEITQPSGTPARKTVDPISYKPYAGVGLSSRIGHMWLLTGGLTVVFGEFPDMSKNEYETTLGFTVRLP